MGAWKFIDIDGTIKMQSEMGNSGDYYLTSEVQSIKYHPETQTMDIQTNHSTYTENIRECVGSLVDSVSSYTQIMSKAMDQETLQFLAGQQDTIHEIHDWKLGGEYGDCLQGERQTDSRGVKTSHITAIYENPECGSYIVATKNSIYVCPYDQAETVHEIIDDAVRPSFSNTFETKVMEEMPRESILFPNFIQNSMEMIEKHNPYMLEAKLDDMFRGSKFEIQGVTEEGYIKVVPKQQYKDNQYFMEIDVGKTPYIGRLTINNTRVTPSNQARLKQENSRIFSDAKEIMAISKGIRTRERDFMMH